MSTPIRQPGWHLVYKHDGSPVCVNDRVNTTSRDHVVTVKGGRPPQHVGSSGRVYVTDGSSEREREYFPHCFDLEWVQV